MANFELNVTINGVEQTLKTVGDLERALQETNQELAGVEKNSRAFTFLVNQSKNIEKVFNAVTEDANEFNKSLKGIDASVKDLGESLTSGPDIPKEFDEAATSARKLDSEMENVVGKSQSLRTELRQILVELQGLEPGSQRFQELSLRAGELRDEIGDTNALINSLAGTSTERLSKALSTTIGIGIAGFQAMEGAAALFGVETDKLQETMVRLQALLNLSQSLEFFGGLGDKIAELKAGFSSLTAVQSSYNAASDAGAVATKGLGLAMKALPIVAIVSALATLAYGIYEYVSANDEATKAEEKRKKELEKLEEQEKIQVQTIAKESAAYVSLLFQLKATNQGSKERNDLIKELNKEYGSTLKNLSDEEQFQALVNDQIKEYIALQGVKFKLSKNLENTNRLLEQQYQAEIDINKYLKENQDLFQGQQIKTREQLAQFSKENESRRKDFVNFGVTLSVLGSKIDDYNRATDKLEKAGQRRADLVQKEKDLLDELFPKREDDKKATDKQADATNKLAIATQFLEEVTRRYTQRQVELENERAKATKSLVDDLEVRRDTEIKSITESYNETLKRLKDEIKDKTLYDKEKRKVDAAYQEYIKSLNTEYEGLIKKQTETEFTERSKLIKELQKQYTILQDEIAFGDQSVVDTLESLNAETYRILLDRTNAELEQNNISAEDFETLQKRKLNLTKLYNKVKQKDELAIQEAEIKRQLDNYVDLLKQQTGLDIKYNDEKEQYEVQFRKRRKDESLIQYLALFEVEIRTQNNINKTKENLEQQLVFRKAAINEKYRNENADAEEETERNIAEKRIAIFRQTVEQVRSSLRDLSSDTTSGFAGLFDNLLTSAERLNDFFRNLDDDFEITAENIGQIFTEIAQVANSVISGFVSQNQALLQQDLQNLRIASDERRDILTTEYNENLANLEAQYNQGLVTEQQYRDALKTIQDNYSSSVEQSDRKLKDAELKAKKEAFEQDKKLRIAQATISGLQGVVAAIAGAMQLGPIAGPIVGAVLGASVTAMTLAQVNQIKKTKFDGGQQVDQNQPTVDMNTTQQQISQASTGGFTGFNQNLVGQPSFMQTTTPTSSTGGQVYILESDITNTQNRVRVLESGASFG